jgi:hypothetical protein
VTPITACNLALAEIGSRAEPISSFSDPSPQGRAAALFYLPKTQMLLRTASWDFARAQETLTVWKEAIVNGTMSARPPPQPWMFSYLWPPDCVKARFVLPTMPVAASGVPLTTAPNPLVHIGPARTSISYVPATDFDTNGNVIRVILTNLPRAQLIYTRDLSQFPDVWDPLFLGAETALLASYFINALARNAAQYSQQVALAKDMILQARIANGNEGITSVDHVPDWIRARSTGGWNWGSRASGGALGADYEKCVFADGLSY